MTKNAPPLEPRNSFGADPESLLSIREWVRQHMLKLAPLALLAATPLTNAACDPANPGSCEDAPRASGQAFWGKDDGNRIVLLNLRTEKEGLQNICCIEGGSLLPTTGKSSQIRIKPDDGAKLIMLTGISRCDEFTVTINLVARNGNSNADPNVEIE